MQNTFALSLLHKSLIVIFFSNNDGIKLQIFAKCIFHKLKKWNGSYHFSITKYRVMELKLVIKDQNYSLRKKFKRKTMEVGQQRCYLIFIEKSDKISFLLFLNELNLKVEFSLFET